MNSYILFFPNKEKESTFTFNKKTYLNKDNGFCI